MKISIKAMKNSHMESKSIKIESSAVTEEKTQSIFSCFSIVVCCVFLSFSNWVI